MKRTLRLIILVATALLLYATWWSGNIADCDAAGGTIKRIGPGEWRCINVFNNINPY
jgi:hypothetical protein